jgi:hypothetical protein
MFQLKTKNLINKYSTALQAGRLRRPALAVICAEA